MTNTFTIEQLRQAVINDYAYLCYDEGGTTADDCSLEEHKERMAKATWDELIEETFVNAKVDSTKWDEELNWYMESWGGERDYTNMVYIKHEDGSTTLSGD